MAGNDDSAVGRARVIEIEIAALGIHIAIARNDVMKIAVVRA
jgi:hypothetical protein